MQVSVLYREPKLLKDVLAEELEQWREWVSVLYREPKLLKGNNVLYERRFLNGFSALP